MPSLIESETADRLAHSCCRFCSCQSPQKQQGSTRIWLEMVSDSIESTYFPQISTNFNKSIDLFWDRWSAVSRYFIINSLQKMLHSLLSSSAAISGLLHTGFWELCAGLSIDGAVNIFSEFLRYRLLRPLAGG